METKKEQNKKDKRTGCITFFVLCVISLIIYYTCNDGSTKPQYSDIPTQNTLDSLSCSFNREFKDAGNDIKRTELNDVYLQKYKDFFNSLPDITGWKGVISHIEEEKGELEMIDEHYVIFKKVSFRIAMENSDKSATIWLNCKHKFLEKDAENDIVFNTVKNIPNDSKVLISGKVVRSEDDGHAIFYYDKNVKGFVLGVNPTNIEMQE